MKENYHRCLLNAGIRPSVQRIAIYAFMKETKSHPDVETVFSSLAPLYPTLSKTTVYNTLKLFEEKKLVRSIYIEDDKLRFDADMTDHIHFKCSCCGGLYDIFNSNFVKNLNKSCRTVIPRGFILEENELCLWGLCCDCAKKKDTADSSGTGGGGTDSAGTK